MSLAISATVDTTGFKASLIRLLTLRSSRVVLAVASVLLLTLFMPLWVSALIMAIIYIHEYGHLWAMKKADVETHGVYAIPLLGAVTVGKVQFVSPVANVMIALAGPATGLPLAILSVPAAVLTQNSHLVLFAAMALVINLFNLLPFFPLDGGKIMHFILAGRNKAQLIFALIALSVSAVLLVTQLSFATIIVAIFSGFYMLTATTTWYSLNKHGRASAFAMDEPMKRTQIAWCASAYLLLTLAMLALGYWLVSSTTLGDLFR